MLAHGGSQRVRGSRAPSDWPVASKDDAGGRFADLADINAGNVGNLKVAFTFSTGCTMRVKNSLRVRRHAFRRRAIVQGFHETPRLLRDNRHEDCLQACGKDTT
jgi:hypothetical protein